MEFQNENDVEVEKILGKKVFNGKTLYLVKWKNYSIQEATWQCNKLLSKVKDKIRQFKYSNRNYEQDPEIKLQQELPQNQIRDSFKRKRGRPPKLSINSYRTSKFLNRQEEQVNRGLNPLRKGRGRPKGSKNKKTRQLYLSQHSQSESLEIGSSQELNHTLTNDESQQQIQNQNISKKTLKQIKKEKKNQKFMVELQNELSMFESSENEQKFEPVNKASFPKFVKQKQLLQDKYKQEQQKVLIQNYSIEIADQQAQVRNNLKNIGRQTEVLQLQGAIYSQNKQKGSVQQKLIFNNYKNTSSPSFQLVFEQNNKEQLLLKKSIHQKLRNNQNIKNQILETIGQDFNEAYMIKNINLPQSIFQKNNLKKIVQIAKTNVINKRNIKQFPNEIQTKKSININASLQGDNVVENKNKINKTTKNSKSGTNLVSIDSFEKTQFPNQLILRNCNQILPQFKGYEQKARQVRNNNKIKKIYYLERVQIILFKNSHLFSQLRNSILKQSKQRAIAKYLIDKMTQEDCQMTFKLVFNLTKSFDKFQNLCQKAFQIYEISLTRQSKNQFNQDQQQFEEENLYLVEFESGNQLKKLTYSELLFYILVNAIKSIPDYKELLRSQAAFYNFILYIGYLEETKNQKQHQLNPLLKSIPLKRIKMEEDQSQKKYLQEILFDAISNMKKSKKQSIEGKYKRRPKAVGFENKTQNSLKHNQQRKQERSENKVETVETNKTESKYQTDKNNETYGNNENNQDDENNQWKSKNTNQILKSEQSIEKSIEARYISRD